MGVQLLKSDNNLIESQLEVCSCVNGHMLTTVLDYLTLSNIYDLRTIQVTDLIDYRAWVDQIDYLTNAQKQSYKSALEQILYSYYSWLYPDFYKSICDCDNLSRAIKNKAFI